MIKHEPLIQSYDMTEAEEIISRRLSVQTIAALQNEAARLVGNMISMTFSGNLQEDTFAIKSFIHDQARYNFIVEQIRGSNDAWQQHEI